MRSPQIWMRVLLAAALLSMGAATASAYSLRIDRSDLNGTVISGDTVIVDLYLDAEPGLFAFEVGVLYDPTVLIYNKAASAALPPKGPGSSGAQASYMLFAPAGALNSVALYPLVTPSFNTWANPPVGLNQVNINFLTNRLFPPNTQSSSASGTNIYIATLLFDVVGSGGTTEIRLCNPGEVPGGNAECGGNVFGVADPSILNDPVTIVLAADITLIGSPITVSFIPEPATGLLLMTGLLAAARWGRQGSCQVAAGRGVLCHQPRIFSMFSDGC